MDTQLVTVQESLLDSIRNNSDWLGSGRKPCGFSEDRNEDIALLLTGTVLAFFAGANGAKEVSVPCRRRFGFSNSSAS